MDHLKTEVDKAGGARYRQYMRLQIIAQSAIATDKRRLKEGIYNTWKSLEIILNYRQLIQLS